MSKTILSILNEIAATPSRNEKEAILRREQNNELLKSVFSAAYNPFINYYIKQIPSVNEYIGGHSLERAITLLNSFSSRKYTGNAAITELAAILSLCGEDDATVIERIIQRDLRCGCSESTPNKIWPGIVPTFDVCLAHKDISNIKFPCYGQTKFDGLRCHLSLVNGKAVALSRNGKTIELLGVLDNDIGFLIKEGQTLDGELLCVKDGKILDRKTGNGIGNKAVKGTISKEEAEMIRFCTWDIVDTTSSIPYNKRIEGLLDALPPYYEETSGRKTGPAYLNKIWVAETTIINNIEESQAFFEAKLAEGQEGAMMKNMDFKWEPKRVKGVGKMKAEEVKEMRIVDLVEGTGKYKGMLGKFICQSEDGLIETGVGSGLSDEERIEYFSSDMIGRVISVCYNQKIQSKNNPKASLFLPRFVELREDKDIADNSTDF